MMVDNRDDIGLFEILPIYIPNYVVPRQGTLEFLTYLHPKYLSAYGDDDCELLYLYSRRP